MFSKRKNKRRERPYSIKKTRIKDENIDRQIIAIHRAIAHKLLAKPELVEQVRTRLIDLRDSGKIRYGTYIHWYSVLAIYDEPENFIYAMVEDTPKMRKLRRQTPFVGVLDESERQSAIEQDAAGIIPSVAVLL